MAEENKAPEEEAPETAEPKEAKAKGPLIPPVVVRYAALGGILVAIGVGALFLITDVIAPRLQKLNQPQAAAEAEVHEEEEAAPVVHEPGEVVLIKDLVVNPAGSGGRRYLKVTAAIEVHHEEEGKGKGGAVAHGGGGGESVSLQEAQIRDLFLRELSSRTLDELTDPLTKEEMRQGILAGLNEILHHGTVSNLYFTEYVVQ